MTINEPPITNYELRIKKGVRGLGIDFVPPSLTRTFEEGGGDFPLNQYTGEEPERPLFTNPRERLALLGFGILAAIGSYQEFKGYSAGSYSNEGSLFRTFGKFAGKVIEGVEKAKTTYEKYLETHADDIAKIRREGKQALEEELEQVIREQKKVWDTASKGARAVMFNQAAEIHKKIVDHVVSNPHREFYKYTQAEVLRQFYTIPQGASARQAFTVMLRAFQRVPAGIISSMLISLAGHLTIDELFGTDLFGWDTEVGIVLDNLEREMDQIEQINEFVEEMGWEPFEIPRIPLAAEVFEFLAASFIGDAFGLFFTRGGGARLKRAMNVSNSGSWIAQRMRSAEVDEAIGLLGCRYNFVCIYNGKSMMMNGRRASTCCAAIFYDLGGGKCYVVFNDASVYGYFIPYNVALSWVETAVAGGSLGRAFNFNIRPFYEGNRNEFPSVSSSGQGELESAGATAEQIINSEIFSHEMGALAQQQEEATAQAAEVFEEAISEWSVIFPAALVEFTDLLDQALEQEIETAKKEAGYYTVVSKGEFVVEFDSEQGAKEYIEYLLKQGHEMSDITLREIFVYKVEEDEEPPHELVYPVRKHFFEVVVS